MLRSVQGICLSNSGLQEAPGHGSCLISLNGKSIASRLGWTCVVGMHPGSKIVSVPGSWEALDSTQ